MKSCELFFSVFLYICAIDAASENTICDHSHRLRASQQKIDFQRNDLILLNSECNCPLYKNRLGICVGVNASTVKVLITGQVMIYSDLLSVPLSTVQRFKIKRSRLKNDYYLTTENKDCIRSILERVDFIDETINSTDQWSANEVPILSVNLCFGRIAHEYGLNGFYYAYNLLLTPQTVDTLDMQDYFRQLGHVYNEFNDFSRESLYDDNETLFFNEFYKKYARFGFRPFDKNNTRLMKVKALKHQICNDRQMRAEHLSDSFGSIIPNISIRNNSRNQIEFPVQSITHPFIQLRVRPKYLGKVSNIFMYESCYSSFPEYRHLIRDILEDPKNDLLFLPHVIKYDAGVKCVGAPINIYSLPIFQLRNKEKYNNLILDMGIASFLIFETRHCLEHWTNAVTSLPFEVPKSVWEKAIIQMKKNMHPDDRRVEKALIKANMEIYDRHYNELMKIKMDKIKDFQAFGKKMAAECKERVARTIGKSIRQNRNFYTKLFTEVGRQMIEMIGEQHPQYLGLYESKGLCVLPKLKALYQTSIFLNYLRSNARGRHLHVICSGCNQHELLWNIKSYMAIELQKAWGIENFNESRTLIDKIVRYPQSNETTST